MKRILQHPEEPKSGKRYWRTLSEFEKNDAFKARLEREFPEGTGELTEEEAGDSRRAFMKLMGAATSAAGLGLAGCRRPEKHILPYSKHVEWVIPGRPLFYATAMPTPDGCAPVVATVHEGRPTHLQGNPLHPVSNGSADSFVTSSILDLYDPDRLQGVLAGGKASSDEKFDAFIGELRGQMDATGGEGVGLLMGKVDSPTRVRLLEELKKAYPKVKLYQNEVISRANHDETTEAVFGAGARQNRRLDLADKILSLDSDFLGLEKLGSKSAGDFAGRRKADEGNLNRLYVVENGYTLTGGMSDHRLPVRTSEIAFVAAMFAKAISKVSGDPLPGKLAGLVKGEIGGTEEWVTRAAEDLCSSKGKALVVCGARQPLAVQALVVAMNAALDAFGSTIDVLQGLKAPQAQGIDRLAEDARDGKISNLFILDGNPAYGTARDLDWANRQKEIHNVISLSDRLDDTAALADWVVPKAHYLESWGDVRSADGTYSVIQPMILPLFGGLSEIDLLLVLLGRRTLVPAEVAEGEVASEPTDAGFKAVEKTVVDAGGGADLQVALKDGFFAGSGFKKIANGAGKLNADAAQALVAREDSYVPDSSGGFEVVFQPDSKVWDGRYVNNGWRQECPDPITKLTWDNCALLSPRTFRELGLKAEFMHFEKPQPMIRVSVNGQSLELPVIEAPGHAHNSVTVTLGYGQKHAGQVGEGTGFDAFQLLSSKAPYVASGATVEPVAGGYLLATTAEHYSMEGRALAREGTVDELQEDNVAVKAAVDALPEDASEQLINDTIVGAATNFKKQGMDSHIPTNDPLYKGQVGRRTEDNPYGFDYENEHQWGMTIDLNQCIGCTACTIACQSENNIPIVGKTQVIQNREMHWIRMDRYFATSDTIDGPTDLEELENPEMINQPVACVQCESAPCETVCPVNATIHTPEGLNAMAYNRCIGTRYCANNCPYKARRFNFFDYNKRNPLAKDKLPIIGEYDSLYSGPLGERGDQGKRGVLDLQKNPNVSVRMRGVMEKCTYCVQRLEEAKIGQKRIAKGSSNTRIPTDSVKTACQQACPSEAIVFGDLADPASAVNRTKLSPRDYELLKYIGTYARTSYLARVKNPNPKMPGAAKVGTATTQFGH